MTRTKPSVSGIRLGWILTTLGGTISGNRRYHADAKSAFGTVQRPRPRRLRNRGTSNRGPDPKLKMRVARHPLWRAVVIFTLLFVTQLSYAGELCRPLAGQGTPAHAATVQELEGTASADIDCEALTVCAEAASESPACTASRLEPSLNAVATTTGFELGIFAGPVGPQRTLAIRTASGAPPTLAATSHPPVRTLFCRYLI